MSSPYNTRCWWNARFTPHIITADPVSYTHLDVYKRQRESNARDYLLITLKIKFKKCKSDSVNPQNNEKPY